MKRLFGLFLALGLFCGLVSILTIAWLPTALTLTLWAGMTICALVSFVALGEWFGNKFAQKKPSLKKGD